MAALPVSGSLTVPVIRLTSERIAGGPEKFALPRSALSLCNAKQRGRTDLRPLILVNKHAGTTESFTLAMFPHRCRNRARAAGPGAPALCSRTEGRAGAAGQSRREKSRYPAPDPVVGRTRFSLSEDHAEDQ